MKLFKFAWLPALLIALVFSSCNMNDDGYSLSDVWVGFGLVETSSDDGSTFIIRLDNGKRLQPMNSVHWFSAKSNQRVLVNFTVLDDYTASDGTVTYYARINNIREILYKGIIDITPEIEDSIGNDPIHVKDAWITRNMLTFELRYWGNNKVHFINLVKQPGELTSADEPIELELRHNNRDDAPYVRMSAFVSFDLSSLQIPGQDSVRFKVTAKGFDDNIYEETGVYKYGIE